MWPLRILIVSHHSRTVRGSHEASAFALCQNTLHALFNTPAPHTHVVATATPSSPLLPCASRIMSLCTLSHWELFWEVYYPWGSLHVGFPVCLALHSPSDGKCLLLLITHRWLESSQKCVHSCVCLPVTLCASLSLVFIRQLWHTALSLNGERLLD